MKIIPTSKGKHTIVDDEDYEWLSKIKWFDSQGYAYTNVRIEKGKFKQKAKHRIIINPPDDKYVDHINGDKSDNRRENLRIVSHAQNTWNTSGQRNKTSKYKGVSFIGKTFRANITHNGIKELIGIFNNEIAASNAYNYYAEKYFGEYARLNKVLVMEKSEWEKHKLKTGEFSSKYKGVTWTNDRGKWEVSTYDKNSQKQTHVGYFEDELVAANYYNHKMQKQVNHCDYIPLEKCEELRYRKSGVSKYRGVSWQNSQNKWRSEIQHEKQKYFIGYFDSEIEAALAYNNKLIELNVKNVNPKLNIIMEMNKNVQ